MGFKSFRKVSLTVFVATVCVWLAGSAASAGRNDVINDINRRTNMARTRAIIEVAEDVVSESPMVGGALMEIARSTGATDKYIEAALNNYELMFVNRNENPIYYRQLELLESLDKAPELYYYVLTEAIPPGTSEGDGTEYFTAALKAYKRFPTSEIFIDNLLGRGLRLLYNERRGVDDTELSDTAEFTLSPERQEFAETLLQWADSIELRSGYMLSVDRARGALYTLMGRKDDALALMNRIESRDSTDIETLDMLTSMAYLNDDSLRVSRIGLRRFELDPDPRYLYSVYDAMPNDSMREQLVEAAFGKVADSDLDPELRMELLSALLRGYYGRLEGEVDTTPLLDRVSAAATEIIEEDPENKEMYDHAAVLAANRHWVRKYGYRYWMRTVDAFPDSINEVYELTSLISTLGVNDTSADGYFEKLIHLYENQRPDLVIPMKLMYAQHLFNNDNYEGTLKMLSPITIDDLREAQRLHAEYLANHPGETDILKEDEDDAESALPTESTTEDSDYLKQWIIIRTLVSDAQMKLNRVDDALATLNHVIALDPNNAGALNNLAYYMCENGRDLTIALSLVDRSLAIAPDNLNAIDTRAWILYMRGDAEGALKEMEKFFHSLNIDINDDLLRIDNEETATEIIERLANAEAVAPIAAHLLSILDALGTIDVASLDRIAELVEKYSPDDAELMKYKNKYHKK